MIICLGCTDNPQPTHKSPTEEGAKEQDAKPKVLFRSHYRFRKSVREGECSTCISILLTRTGKTGRYEHVCHLSKRVEQTKSEKSHSTPDPRGPKTNSIGVFTRWFNSTCEDFRKRFGPKRSFPMSSFVTIQHTYDNLQGCRFTFFARI